MVGDDRGDRTIHPPDEDPGVNSNGLGGGRARQRQHRQEANMP
ncbi:MAG: hypothetical protein AB1679_16205 [Actinomycetota bacterium]|jgi:hypothetical protein